MTGKPLSMLLDEIVVAEGLLLPLPPHAARKGLMVVDGNPSLTELSELFRHDPVLAATLFRQANSAFYRGLAPVGGIDDALTRLGVDAVLETLREHCAAAVAVPPGQLLPAYLPRLWQHSLGCALGASWLAERCGYRLLAEQAHLAGLLHDLGKFALLVGVEQLAGEARLAPLLAPPLVESILASRHVEVGLRLHADWGLPEGCAPVIARHHGKGVEGQELMVILVRLANQGCRKLGLGLDCNPELVLPTTAEAQFLGLDEIALAEFEIMLEDRFLPGLSWRDEVVLD